MRFRTVFGALQYVSYIILAANIGIARMTPIHKVFFVHVSWSPDILDVYIF